MKRPTNTRNRIREIRKARGLGWTELAVQLGWERLTLWRLESGATKLDAERALALADALGCTVGQLVGTEPLAEEKST